MLVKKGIHPRKNSYGSSNSVDMKRDIVEAAFRDIGSLETESKMKALFDESLQEIASAVSVYLEIGKRNPKELFQLFSSYRVTCDPKIGWQYDTDGNAFVINLLDLLYYPAWSLASAFVHEGGHVLFLKGKGMLNAPESEQEEFAQKFRRESEIRALKAELQFLLSIRPYVHPTTRMFMTRKSYFSRKIDHAIKNIKNCLRDLKESKDTQAKGYREDMENRTSSSHLEMASALGMKLPMPNFGGKYEILRIVFPMREN